MNIAIFAVATGSLIVSSATLVVVVVAGRRAKREVEEVRLRANKAVSRARLAMDQLEF